MNFKISNNKKIVLFLIVAFWATSVRAFSIEKTEDKIEDRFIVHPAKVDFQLNPGQIKEFDLIVANRLGREENFSIQKEDYKNESLSVLDSDWVTVDNDNFTLKSGERATVKVRIAIPAETDLGGHYLALVVKANQQKDNQSGNVKLISQIKIPLWGKIGGTNNEIVGYFLFNPQKFFFLTGPVFFDAKLRNEGNVHFEAQGEMSITNFLGIKVAQLPFKTRTVLPGSEENFEIVWRRNYPIGLYQAEINARLDDQDEIIKQTKKFIVFPLHWFLLIMLATWLLAKGLKKIEKKYAFEISVQKK